MNYPKSNPKLIVLMACLFTAVLFFALHVNSQQLQKGVSVQLAPTTNAKPVPDADQLDAWVVSITSDGRLWFGTDLVNPDVLAEKMVETPRHRGQNLYIKADARARYSHVAQVLKAAHATGFESPVLLTGQPAPAQPGTLALPMGLAVWIESGALTGPKPIEIELATIEGSSAIHVNEQQVSWTSLASTIKQLSNQPDTVVRLRADGEVPFGQVARAIDAAASAGAKVVLAMPTV
jgi:biopolymer transport protein ExbD